MSECIQISFAVCRIGIYTVSNVYFCSTKCHENINEEMSTGEHVELWELPSTASGSVEYAATGKMIKLNTSAFYDPSKSTPGCIPHRHGVIIRRPMLGLLLAEVFIKAKY